MFSEFSHNANGMVAKSSRFCVRVFVRVIGITNGVWSRCLPALYRIAENIGKRRINMVSLRMYMCYNYKKYAMGGIHNGK